MQSYRLIYPCIGASVKLDCPRTLNFSGKQIAIEHVDKNQIPYSEKKRSVVANYQATTIDTSQINSCIIIYAANKYSVFIVTSCGWGADVGFTWHRGNSQGVSFLYI